jgi:amino acid transporter
MYPTSGGQYHWVALLAPPKYAKFFSWLSGWVSSLGWQAGAASGTFLAGTMIQGLLALNNPTYGYKRWHGTLLLYAVLALSLFVNTILIRLMPYLEGCILVLHVLGFFAILIPLVHLAPMSSAKFVFATFINEGGYPDGLSWFVGLTASSVLFIGYDGAVHMAEEVKNAAVNVPRSMFFTIFLNGALGIASFIALLFSIGDIDSALSTPTGWPFIQIFYNATNSKAGTTAMVSLLIALIVFATFSYVASASRQLWAFARDKGVPGWRVLSIVDKRFHIPLYALGVTAMINALLGLINIGSTTAFNAIISLLSAGLFSSYLITIGLLIRKRLVHEPLYFGPWSMGRWGLPINIIAFVYTTIVMVFSFFPPFTPVTAVSMNWSCVMFGGVVILGLIYFAFIARHEYKGPVVDRHLISSIPSGKEKE